MFEDILIPFITICLAELGDKSQLLVLLLSTKTKKHAELLIGVSLAFLIVDGIAILVGSWVTNIIPINLLKILSAIVFIIFGIITLRGNHEDKKIKLYSNSPFVSGFLMILISEWGDKTQIASALFATKYNPLMVLFGVIVALISLSAVVIYLGKAITNRIDKNKISKIAGTIFILVGLSFFFI